MNEPVKNRITVYEVERFCERLHKLVIETHPSLGEPSFELETGRLRVSFPGFQASVESEEPQEPSALDGITLEQAQEIQTAAIRSLVDGAAPVKPRKSKKVPQ